MRVRGKRATGRRGPFKYANHLDNHVVWPGREPALQAFLGQTYGGMQHKLKNAKSSNSEDALTWSCFDALRQVGSEHRARALGEIWELAFSDLESPPGVASGDIFIGKAYGETAERTEVDLSIEGAGVLVFVEAKLYSPMSQVSPKKPHNQIARKLRVGVQEALKRRVQFYFLILDLAPPDALLNLERRVSLRYAETVPSAGFGSKWLTAYWFTRYKYGRNGSLTPLKKILDDPPSIRGASAPEIAKHMGWVAWADVFKSVLRAVIADRR
jgi:hypothetical protein